MTETRTEDRFTQWLEYVEKTVQLLEWGGTIPLGPARLSGGMPKPMVPVGKGVKILVAAPHPDDEALIGALPLRWRLEAGACVVNCAITLGSAVDQRPRRAAELRGACRVLGFGLVIPNGSGFSDVTLRNRQEAPAEWASKVETLRRTFDEEAPDVVFVPHAEDFQATHVGTHYLVVEALERHLEGSAAPPLPLIETEFWHELAAPNLMVEVPPEVLALQVMATAEHAGEVSRNPYHLRLPARLVDNVRRGSEVVGGQGSPARPYQFAELYRVTFIKGKEHLFPRLGGRALGCEQRPEVQWLRSEFGLE